MAGNSTASVRFKKNELKNRKGWLRLGQICNDIINNAGGPPGDVADRWSVSVKMYDGEPGASGIDIATGAAKREVNIVAPNIDESIDAISEQNIGQKPYCQVVPLDGRAKRADTIEKGIQDICDSFEFGEFYRQVMKDALLRSVGIIHLPFSEEAGFSCSTVHPEDFRVYPQNKPGFEHVQFVAHVFRMVRIEIQDKVDSGDFIKPESLSGGQTTVANLDADSQAVHSDAEGGEDTAAWQTMGAAQDFDLIALWDCKIKVRCGTEAEWYRLIVHNSTGCVLCCEPWPYEDQSDYVAGYLDRDPKRWYSRVSLAYRLQNLQYAYSQFWACVELGTEMEAFPPIIGSLSLKNSITKLEPGMIVPSNGVDKVQIVNGRANPMISREMLALIKEEAQTITRIARTSLAGEPSQNTTATASMQIAAGQQRSEGGLADRASGAVEAVWELILSKCKAHPEEVAKVYPFLSDEFFEAIADCEVKIIAAGRDPSVNPVVYRQALVDFKALASQNPEMWDVAAIDKKIAESLDLPFEVEDFVRKNEQGTAAGLPADPGVPNNQGLPPIGVGQPMPPVGGPGAPAGDNPLFAGADQPLPSPLEPGMG